MTNSQKMYFIFLMAFLIISAASISPGEEPLLPEDQQLALTSEQIKVKEASPMVSLGKPEQEITADLRLTLEDIARQAGVSLFLPADLQGKVVLHYARVKLEEALTLLLAGTNYEFFRDTNNIYVIRKTATASQSQENANPEESQPLITNVFMESDLRQALMDVAAQAKINILMDDTVTGWVTLELTDVPLEKALEMMLLPYGFVYKKMDGFYIVGSADLKNPAFNILSSTEVIKLNYIKAGQIPRLLSEFYQPYVMIDEATNNITVTGPPAVVQRVKEDLAKIDRPPQQIMIEAMVTELSEEASKTLGVDWTWGWSSQSIPGSVSEGEVEIQNLVAGLTYTTTGEFTRKILASLKLLVDKGQANIRANPRLATLEGQPASIFVGRKEYFVVDLSTETEITRTLQTVDVGVTLKIVPYVTEQQEITVEIEPEVSELSTTGRDTMPSITRRSAKATIRVKDGETIVIGGLRQQNKFTKRTKIPLLGDLPIIGFFFSSSRTITTTSEVVVLITPHILREGTSS